MGLAELLDDGASLFKFAERGHVHPNDAGGGVDGLLHAAEEVPASFDPEPGLGVSRRDEPDEPHVERQTEII